MASEPRHRPRGAIVGLVAVLLTGGGSMGLASAQPGPPQRPEPPGPPPAGPVPPERIGPEVRPPEAGGAGGVIRPPPGVDPAMPTTPAVPAPDPGTTPVIPPPGTPGGDPRVQPR